LSQREIEKVTAQINAIYEGLSFILSRIDEIEKAAQGDIDTWDPNKIKWIHTEGASGAYEKADPQGLKDSDFDLMLKDLKAHSGKLTHEDYFYWVFKDQATVGRKKRRK